MSSVGCELAEEMSFHFIIEHLAIYLDLVNNNFVWDEAMFDSKCLAVEAIDELTQDTICQPGTDDEGAWEDWLVCSPQAQEVIICCRWNWLAGETGHQQFYTVKNAERVMLGALMSRLRSILVDADVAVNELGSAIPV